MFKRLASQVGAALLLFTVAVASADSFAAENSANRIPVKIVQNGGLLNSMEARVPARLRLPHWAKVLKTMNTDRKGFARCASDISKCDTPERKEWSRLISSATGMDKRDQLETVNRFFNRYPYRKDPKTYGVPEYWASPDEFLKRSGDCEDFAIVKFFALRQLGFSDNDLRIVVVYDWLRRIPHAVLAVHIDGDILILDNTRDYIVSHRQYRYYEPRVSMNESGNWVHVKPRLRKSGT